ncbi:transcription cofactor vestigial-like protein 3 isoform B [Alligator mississippiensis]|uniref:Transcription cofactor vestigial-like protein 3 isoform B n=1 Tax=Alligator mississippiensis TaxID=8496 RepID=A0A151ME05_ALLMI|nr:transcription cofactor vestigial-like protein 3 isoform B [Alligator mississippiensis]
MDSFTVERHDLGKVREQRIELICFIGYREYTLGCYCKRWSHIFSSWKDTTLHELKKKLAVYAKMQESLEGDIGSVVDEHFSRALSQASSFNPETALSKSKAGLSPLWRESSTISSQRSSFPTSFWTGSYQPPPPPCLSGAHPDFSVTASSTFPTADPSSWPGHSLHHTAPPPPSAASDSWHYPLTSQCDVTKTDPTAVTSATSAWAGAFHGTVDIVPSFGFDAGLQHQEKTKESSWF